MFYTDEKSDKKSLIIAGPCSMENMDQFIQVCETMDRTHTIYVRAAIFKPRTHPESFQGLGAEAGLKILENAKSKFPQLKYVSEVCSEEQLKSISEHIHGIQIGARNMQNFELLKKLGQYFNPLRHDFILLKRGFANSLDEWFAAAEYIVRSGVPRQKIILCERGIRVQSSHKNVVLDFNTAIMAKLKGHYRVIIDPSHGSKDAQLVLALAQMAMHGPFDGLMIETHPTPRLSMSDAEQALSLEEYSSFKLAQIGKFSTSSTTEMPLPHSLL